jgi:Peptidase A4 family
MKRLLASGVAAALLLSSAAAAAPRDAESTSVTHGWAGYVVSAGGASFEEVHGSWVQPRIVCNRPGSFAAFWLGLGGATTKSEALEQIGTSADCSERAVPSYSAWYQLFPARAVEVPFAVRPGDTLAASISVSGRIVTLGLRNLTTDASYRTDVWTRAPEVDSAEWIVEAPSICFTSCVQLPLADFGRVAFTDTSTTVGTHSGTIADAGWSRRRLEMGLRGGRRAAVPTALLRDGSSFAVIRSKVKR